ncbi:MAG TPA: type II glyceraldehyde-3-phosphate dehydrogenase [Nitrososphaeraceae archaeon]|nr:type II glyceraldehyde-3-phosphate dehydrogenase [Nitrososphaeraceae archaeon]
MAKIFINGYGNIGRRLASALSLDKEIQFVGIAKYTADEKTKEALENRFNVYVPKDIVNKFKEKNYDIAGTLTEAIAESDLIIDAAKEGTGYDNKKNLYEPMNKSAIFQGGEERHGHRSVAEMIHNSRVNYDKALGRKYVIQGSCNVSGMGRIIQPLIENFGDEIRRFDVSLIRRWADLEDSKEVKDSIEWDKNPHHQDDVKDFIPSVNLYVDAFKVPSRMMHLHHMLIYFKEKAPPKDVVIETFRKEFGVAILNSAKGTADIRKKAFELEFQHGDTNMIHIHTEVLKVQEDLLKISYSDDQTGMVIPENYMLVQSMIHGCSRGEAIKKTDNLFQITRKRNLLEQEFR